MYGNLDKKCSSHFLYTSFMMFIDFYFANEIGEVPLVTDILFYYTKYVSVSLPLNYGFDLKREGISL